MTVAGYHWVLIVYSTLGYPHLAWVGDYATKEECVSAGDKLTTAMFTCITPDRMPKPERLGDGDFSQ